MSLVDGFRVLFSELPALLCAQIILTLKGEAVALSAAADALYRTRGEKCLEIMRNIEYNFLGIVIGLARTDQEKLQGTVLREGGLWVHEILTEFSEDVRIWERIVPFMPVERAVQVLSIHKHSLPLVWILGRHPEILNAFVSTKANQNRLLDALVIQRWETAESIIVKINDPAIQGDMYARYHRRTGHLNLRGQTASTASRAGF